MRRSPAARKNMWIKMVISLTIIALGCVLLGEGIKRQIGPNLDAVSSLKAKGIVMELINETIREEFPAEEDEKEMIIIKTGRDGKIQMVQANTPLINKTVASFAESLQEKYGSMGAQEVDIAYGTLLGSKILSQSGLGISIKVLPLSVTGYDFETEFEGQGINQTKYKVYIVLESDVRILQPFSDRNIKIKNKVLIAEAVILGEVPESYVNVPEEDILDVT